MRQQRIRAVSAIALIVALAVAASCGVPTGDDTFDPIEDADVPLNLAEPSTTTTTTTTTMPATTVPAPTTTTGAQPQTAPVSLYFVLGDELLPIVQDTVAQFTAVSLIDLLARGPDPTTSPGLETLIDEDLVNEITVRGGVASVDIDESELFRVRRSQRALLFGQMVLTLTFNARTVGIVEFSFDGVPGNAELPNNIFQREVTFEDYVDLLANAIIVPESSSTTTSTTAPTTTVPDETVSPTTTSTTVPDATDSTLTDTTVTDTTVEDGQ